MIEKMNAKKLAEAIRGYDIDQLKKLLKDGASPDEYTDKDSYFTPLIDAIDELDDGGSAEAVQLLIAAGADVNRWNKEGALNPSSLRWHQDVTGCFRYCWNPAGIRISRMTKE
jgi:ankyrin repeat protein